MTIFSRAARPEYGRYTAALRDQARGMRSLLTAIYLPVVAAFVVVVIVRVTAGIPIPTLTRDALQVLEAPAYVGVVSTFGGLLWAGTAGICLFAAAAIHGRSGATEVSRFLLASGGVTLLLMLDDVFLMHDVVLPIHAGIPEVMVYLAYALVLMGFLALFRGVIAETDFLLLLLAFAGLGFSVGLDVLDMLLPFGLRGEFLIEDTAKLLGIVSWAAYFARVALKAIGRL